MLKTGNKIWSAILLSVFLLGMDGSAQEKDERRQLAEQQKRLGAKVESLKREQDLLLFQKEFYSAESKYLILNIPAGKGELRYKNRLLKSFSFALSSKARLPAIPVGAATVTRKVEGRGKRYEIMFGRSFIMKGKAKGAGFLPKDRTLLPRLFVSRKDIQSIFYAVEEGSKAYVLQ